MTSFVEITEALYGQPIFALHVKRFVELASMGASWKENDFSAVLDVAKKEKNLQNRANWSGVDLALICRFWLGHKSNFDILKKLNLVTINFNKKHKYDFGFYKRIDLIVV